MKCAQRKLFALYGVLIGILLMGVACLIYFFYSISMATQMPAAFYDYEEVQALVTTPKDTEGGGEYPSPPVYDAAELLAINSDFKGWLSIPDTQIHFPVVQGSDNDFYLKHSFYKKYSEFGCLFLDADTQPDDRSLVIHGHNMGQNRTEMFSSLVAYQDPSFATSHKYIFYSNPEKNNEEVYTVFAVLNLNLNDKRGFNYRQQRFADDTEFKKFVSFLCEKSIYSSGVFPSNELIILSTCNRAYGTNNRLLVCAGR